MTIDTALINEQRTTFRGALLRNDEEGYEATRRVWNGAVDRKPALIARCAGADDVATAVPLRPPPRPRGEHEPEVAQLLGAPLNWKWITTRPAGSASVLTVPRIHHMSSPVSGVSSKIGRLSRRSLHMPICATTGPSSSPAGVR